MGASMVFTGVVTTVGLDWMAEVDLLGSVGVVALAFELTLLLGSLMNLTAVVGGWWD